MQIVVHELEVEGKLDVNCTLTFSVTNIVKGQISTYQLK